MRGLTLLGALVSVVMFVSACVKPPPDADGRALAEIHIQLLEAGDLTTEQLVEDLKKAKARHETPEAQEAFERAYAETIRPARTKLAVMMLKDSSKESLAALRELGAELGVGFKEMMRQLADSLGTEDERNESLRKFGRELGKTLRDLSESMETVADGVGEGLREKD